MIQQYLDQGYQGYLMTMMFNQLSGSEQQKNHQMQVSIEGMYASLLTRMVRNPKKYPSENPILIACPDWPVHKHYKVTLSEVITNDGLHYHGILMVPPQCRLKIPVEQHFIENQDYYCRDGILNHIDVRPIADADAPVVVDDALKGLKTGRLPSDEDLLLLPNPQLAKRPYLGNLTIG